MSAGRTDPARRSGLLATAERAILGPAMSLVARILERTLLRSLKRGDRARRIVA